MKFQLNQIGQLGRFTGHKRMIMTLGVGAMALTVVACGSSVVDEDLPEGDPLPQPAQGGQNDAAFNLGAPAGIGVPGDGNDGGATSGTVVEGVRGETVSESIGIAPYYKCDATVSHPTLFIEGEPVTVDPAPGVVIYDLEDYVDEDGEAAPQIGTLEEDPGGPFVNEPTPDLYVQDGISLGMPVPGLADVTEMVVEDAPEPVSAPPSILPMPEDLTIEPIAMPVYECESDSTSSDGSGSSDSGSSTIEPIPYPGDEVPSNIEIVEAPIESAAVTVAESFPPQYSLWVVSGLSSAASTFGDYAVKRDGNVVAIRMTNYVRTDVMAAQVYGIHQSNIALGGEFESGQTYDVVINGRSWTTFTAQ